MYEGGIKSGYKKVLNTVFILFAIVVICIFGKIVLDHVSDDGFVVDEKDCQNSEATSILENAGVFGGKGSNCKESDDKEEDEEEETESETSAKAKRKK
ncbi:MAG: hypothetical protein MJ154_03920 [Candidatus Saccharibacteria bacterium]|nr:hypothetical protein [Candidatus Saccharibacteria bacterium]